MDQLGHNALYGFEVEWHRQNQFILEAGSQTIDAMACREREWNASVAKRIGDAIALLDTKRDVE
jgi:hypothetical protein